MDDHIPPSIWDVFRLPDLLEEFFQIVPILQYFLSPVNCSSSATTESFPYEALSFWGSLLSILFLLIWWSWISWFLEGHFIPRKFTVGSSSKYLARFSQFCLLFKINLPISLLKQMLEGIILKFWFENLVEIFGIVLLRVLFHISQVALLNLHLVFLNTLAVICLDLERFEVLSSGFPFIPRLEHVYKASFLAETIFLFLCCQDMVSFLFLQAKSS